MTDIKWEESFPYVACYYGDLGDEPGDCYLRVGWDPETKEFVVDDGDDDERPDEWRFPSREEALAFAQGLAEEQDEGEGLDVEALSTKRAAERRERATDDGEFAVVFVDPETGRRDVGLRFDDEGDAEAEVDSWYEAVSARNQGTSLIWSLMTTPQVMRLQDGEWVSAADD